MARVPGTAGVRTTGALRALTSGSSAGTLGTRFDFGQAFSKWALRCQVTGAATEASVQLKGSVATSSEANTVLVALTTWILTANSCDSVVFIADKPVTSVICELTTVGGATGATVSAWIAGAP